MTRIAVVTDSAACIPQMLRQSLGIFEIPFEVIWDGQVYRDGVDLAPSEFYERFRQAQTRPTTSQPALAVFTSLYARLGKAAAGIVSIHASGELTGTVHTARQAASEARSVPIRIIDSRTATMAEGFVVLAAARAAAAGAALEQVVAAAEQVVHKVDFFATLKTLEHVHRGGRLGDAATLLGNHLRIVPILNLKEGRVRVVSLAHTWGNAQKQLLELTMERLLGRRGLHISVFHADALKEAEWLQDQISARVTLAEFYLTEFTPVMGAHTGPDVVGAAFYADD